LTAITPSNDALARITEDDVDFDRNQLMIRADVHQKYRGGVPIVVEK